MSLWETFQASKQQVPFNVSIKKLFGGKDKIIETLNDIKNNQLSHAIGKPITVSCLDNPRGSFFMMDGYHRVIQALMNGQTTISACVDVYMPRIERTGGGYKNMVDSKIPMMQSMDLLRSMETNS